MLGCLTRESVLCQNSVGYLHGREGEPPASPDQLGISNRETCYLHPKSQAPAPLLSGRPTPAWHPCGQEEQDHTESLGSPAGHSQDMAGHVT